MATTARRAKTTAVGARTAVTVTETAADLRLVQAVDRPAASDELRQSFAARIYMYYF